AELQSPGAESGLHRGAGRAYPRPRGPADAGAGAHGGRLRTRTHRRRTSDSRRSRAPDATMKLFDPHIHMTSRTTADYGAVRAAGRVALGAPAFGLGQPRTHVGPFGDYFGSLLGGEPSRASQFGIRHFCTLALNPKEANDPRVADGVLALLPRYLGKDGVV